MQKKRISILDVTDLPHFDIYCLYGCCLWDSSLIFLNSRRFWFYGYWSARVWAFLVIFMWFWGSAEIALILHQINVSQKCCRYRGFTWHFFGKNEKKIFGLNSQNFWGLKNTLKILFFFQIFDSTVIPEPSNSSKC